MADPGGGIAWVFGKDGQIILAGVAGGVIRWMTLRQNWREGMISLVSGGICAYYLGPVGTWIFRPVFADPAQQATMSGFLVGFIGLGIAGFIMDFWNRRKSALLGGKEDDDAGSR